MKSSDYFPFVVSFAQLGSDAVLLLRCPHLVKPALDLDGAEVEA